MTDDRRYLESHEWALAEGNVVTVGLSDFAVKHLSDLVFIQLPEAGEKVEHGERLGEIESVKAVSDINSPVTGEVVEVNTNVADNLELISSDPFGDGWLVRIQAEDLSELEGLLDEESYEKQLDEEDGKEDEGEEDEPEEEEA